MGDPPVGADDVEQASFRLPVGTVTFLLTDVEGSTRLWETAPQAMKAAIARHYEILDAVISRHGGVRPEEQGEGDRVVAAFARASDAIAAAADAQRAFVREPWPAGASLRVRIAVHTGEAQQRDERNYFGQAIIGCARLRAIAYGAQTVVSRTTRDLSLGRLPKGVALVDLGIHRLRDLGRPEQVFGLMHPALPAEFPSLRSPETMPTNLPSELTSFVGRHHELTQIGQLLGQARLLTLTGAGGCGKTRLALQAAADALDGFPDGVWWVQLARIEDPALVAAAVIAALGLRETPGRSLLDMLMEYLAAREVLLVLDNCEHLVEACAALVDALLRGCASLTVLATSRAPLGVPGEITWRVPEAVAYVRRARGERKRPSRGWGSLTTTEMEVVRHIAAGLTNRQIGQQMFIAPGTVKTHLAHIFAKLDTPTRSHLAAEATKHRLTQDNPTITAGRPAHHSPRRE